MIAKKIKILIKSDGSYLDTILPPITANEDGRTIVQVTAPFPITDIVSVNYSIRPIQATVKGSYLLPTGKFGKDVLDEDYTHFQTVADWNVFEIPINAVALEYISKYRAGLVLVSFTIKQLQTPYFATNYLGLFSDTNPIPTTTYNDGDYFIANEYNFTAHDITWAKGDYAYFYNGKWNKGKSVLKASTPSIELPVDPSLKDAPQLEYDEDVALLLANDLGLLTQRVSQSETDIESAENDINEIDGRVGVNETDIYNLESDVDDLETEIGNIKNGTTIVKKAEQDANGNVITSTYETKIDATNKLATKVDKTQKIIGIDLQDDILLTEFKTALGNATQSVAGLLSAEDKTHLDGLVALLESSDGNNVVDTIGEILEIFNNYPEGADLVTALNGKVDKVAGKGLSQNDLTDILKANLLSAYAHSQVVNSNPHKTTYQQLLNKPTTIEQLGVTNVYNKQYIDALKDKNGWESELLGTLSNNETIDLSVINQYDEIQMYAKDTLGVIDNENIRPSLMQSGDSVYFFDDTQAFIMVDTVFGFYAPAGWELQIVGLKYTELKAIDTTYDNTESEMTATTVQEAIDELENEIDVVETTITNITNGTTDITFTDEDLTATNLADAVSEVNINVGKRIPFDTKETIYNYKEFSFENSSLGYLNSDGTIDSTLTVFSVSDFIDLKDIVQVFRYGSETLYYIEAYALYDINKNLISYTPRISSYDFSTYKGRNDVIFYNINIEGARYIRITKETAYTFFNYEVYYASGESYTILNNFYSKNIIENQTIIETIENDNKLIKNALSVDINKLSNKNIVVFKEGDIVQSGHYLEPSNGNVYNTESTSTYDLSDYISVSNGDNLTLCYARSFGMYDKEKNYLGGVEVSTLSGYTGNYVLNDISLSNENIAYIRVNFYTSRIYGITRKANVYDVLNLGDSIFGINPAPYDISTYAQIKTGFTFANCGFGGTHASTHYQPDYDKFSFYKLAESIYNEDFSVQDGVDNVNSLSAFYKYRLQVLRNIDFTKLKALTVAYGTNDWNNGDAIDNLSNPYDITTFCGGLRYGIEKILEKYPHIIICLLSPIYRTFDGGTDSDSRENINNKKLTDFCEAMKSVAREYHLPYFDHYNDMNINKFNSTTYLIDNTHLTYVKGAELLGNKLGAEIEQIIN